MTQIRGLTIGTATPILLLIFDRFYTLEYDIIITNYKEKRNIGGNTSMNIDRLIEKRNIFQKGKTSIDAVTLSSYEKDFELTFTHNSTTIEGNTLTLLETKVVL